MAVQKGADLLMKHGSGSPVSYTTIAGLRDTSISISQGIVDVTNKDDARVRKLLAQGETKSFTVSGSGIFTDASVEALVLTNFDDATLDSYQFLVPDFYTFTGKFQVTSIEYSGSYNGAVEYSMTFESADTITLATV
jgi:TP901-1 family phage major tail protein